MHAQAHALVWPQVTSCSRSHDYHHALHNRDRAQTLSAQVPGRVEGSCQQLSCLAQRQGNKFFGLTLHALLLCQGASSVVQPMRGQRSTPDGAQLLSRRMLLLQKVPARPRFQQQAQHQQHRHCAGTGQPEACLNAL